jgi:hypothetical protein
MNYNEKQVFDIPLANNTIDLLYHLIENYLAKFEIAGVDLSKDIGLSGKAAKKLQGGAVANVNSIAFVTNKQLLFEIISKVVDDIPNTGILKFKNKITIENSNFFIEIHKIATTLSNTTVDGVFVQLLAEIPENLLS